MESMEYRVIKLLGKLGRQFYGKNGGVVIKGVIGRDREEPDAKMRMLLRQLCDGLDSFLPRGKWSCASSEAHSIISSSSASWRPTDCKMSVMEAAIGRPGTALVVVVSVIHPLGRCTQ